MPAARTLAVIEGGQAFMLAYYGDGTGVMGSTGSLQP
jgi:hypothetical protein